MKSKYLSNTIPTTDNGTLSGYVRDTSMNPIMGAKVKVSYHGTYRQDYTDNFGYYRVTNIPICYCLKNCTTSKEGFITEEIQLSIDENTTYDFTLTCLYYQADANGPYAEWDMNPIQFYGSAYCGAEPYTWHWDFGDNKTSDEQNPIHYYTNTGYFTVVLTITDNDDSIEEDSTIAIMKCQPYSLYIDGPNQGKPGIPYEYEFIAYHPDYDDIIYYIDWNDGTITNWTPYIPAGQAYTEKHIWDSEGTFSIRAKAKFYNGCESPWAEYKVKISNPRNRTFSQGFLDMFLLLERILNIIQ